MTISIVIPIYKNEENIDSLVEMLNKQFLEFLELGLNLEPVLVIDGSPDGSLNILIDNKQRGALPSVTKIVKLSRNFGQISALIAGMEVSTGECVICYSADMQDPASLFVPMYRSFESGNEIVLAVRESRSDHWFRNLTSKLGYGLLRLEIPEVPKGGFDFFLVSGHAKEFLLNRSGARRFLQGDILKLGYSREVIRYSREKRILGKSSYTFRKRLALFTDAFYDTSDFPIKFGTRLGFAIAAIGFLTTFFVLASYIKDESPFNGFTALLCATLILGGLQLALIGIIGEYIYRTFDIVRNRPRFIIEKIY
jgi:glycosyltransferase involved in cell wall biosynthesis